MSLIFTGLSISLPDGGKSFQARSAEGHAVAVKASEEAIEDYGEEAVKVRGAEKYDVGEFTYSGGSRIVTVRTTDFPA